MTDPHDDDQRVQERIDDLEDLPGCYEAHVAQRDLYYRTNGYMRPVTCPHCGTVPDVGSLVVDDLA